MAVYHAPPRVLGTLVNSRGLELGTTPCVALTTWETSAVPERVIVQNRLHEFDAMITPSGFCSDAFDHAIAVHAGHARKVHTVPHCYDEHFWRRMNQREFDQDDTLRGCRFYAMGAWGDRKNMLGVLKAYLHAFTRADNVSLTMILDEKANLDEVRSVLACSMIPQHLMPKISIPPPRELSEYDLLALHSEHDCFVSATRGEGWGLSMFEAAIMGREVIAPAWGGQADFLEGYPFHRNVPHQLTPCFATAVIEQVEGGISNKVQIPPGVDCKQLWADPDLRVLARQMRQVYLESSKASFHLRDVQPARQAFDARFGYRVVGPQLANILRGIAWSPTHSSSTSSS